MQGSPQQLVDDAVWQIPPTSKNSLIKVFHFPTNSNMGRFLVGVLSCHHDTQVSICAEEKTPDVIVVSINGTMNENTLIWNEDRVSELVSAIDRLYLEECIPQHDSITPDQQQKHNRTVWTW